LQRWREGGLIMQQIVTCATCHGQGRVYTVPCATCHGQGRIEREEAIAISIPVGIEEGMVLRVPGQGLPSREPGGVPGDLFVVLRIQPDDRFERRGIDLWQTVTISVEDSVLGTQVDIPTLQEPFSLTLVPGTQPDTVLRLQQYGLPEFGGYSRGDMFVRVHVHVPERLSREERALYESLRHLKQGATTSSDPRHTTDTPPSESATAPPGLKRWLVKLWDRIDTQMRRWLQTDEGR
jgi:molecular chaperone DnaJ